MNSIRDFRQLTPRVDPLTPEIAERIWSRAVKPESGTVQRAGPSTVEEWITVEQSPTATRQRRPRQRVLVGVAAALVVVAGLAGVAVIANLDTQPVGTTPTAPSTNTISSATEPSTAPSVLTQTVPTVVESAPTIDGPTRLVLERPPAGFAFDSAEMQDNTVGIATYRSNDHNTELQIIVRDAQEVPPPVDLFEQRPTWTVDDRTVWSDGEGDGRCLPDVCSIGLLWDANTSVTLAWVDPNAAQLIDGSTQGALLDLVPNLTADPSVWVDLDALTAPENQPTSRPAPGRVVVANANGLSGSAGRTTAQLESLGVDIGPAVNSNQQPRTTSVIQTTPGAQCLAIQLSVLLGIEQIDLVDPAEFAIEASQSVDADVVLVLGEDLANESSAARLGGFNDAITTRGDARCDR